MKTSREIVIDIFNRKNSDYCAMWTGHPSDAAVPILAKEWGIEADREAIFNYLDDDCRWIPANSGCRGMGIRPYYGMEEYNTLGGAGCLANAETVKDIEEMYPWDKDYKFDFSGVYDEIDKFPDKAVFTGIWATFYHDVAAFFGMENYFCLMYENPIIVEALTEKIVDYYVAMSEAFFEGLGSSNRFFEYLFEGGGFLSAWNGVDEMLSDIISEAVKNISASAWTAPYSIQRR